MSRRTTHKWHTSYCCEFTDRENKYGLMGILVYPCAVVLTYTGDFTLGESLVSWLWRLSSSIRLRMINLRGFYKDKL